MRRPMFKPLFLAITCTGLAACMPADIKPINATAEPPAGWQRDQPSAPVTANWLAQLQDVQLQQLVSQALADNRGLAQSRLQVEQARQQLVISGAAQLPTLDLSSGISRAGSASGAGRSTADSFSLEGRLSWQLDIWGQLDDQQRQAQLNLAAQQASLADAEQQLVRDLARGWYQLQEAQLLQALFEQRRSNLQENLSLVQARYQQGLNSALDIYLARNDLHAEQARISAQQQTVLQARRAVEQLLGSYPAGQVRAEDTLPLLDSAIPAGLPAGLVSRRPDLQASWLRLLAADAAVAIAQKDRFPAITLTSNLGSRSDALADLLQSGNLAWSLAGALSQSLFDGGRREALQAQRLAERQQLEQSYLDTVYKAFEQVENLLSNHSALQQQYSFYVQARDNAETAETLAFEQYQKGLASYTTVLESQRRAFDARTSVIRLRSQLLVNRVELYRALGGDFNPAAAATESGNNA